MKPLFTTDAALLVAASSLASIKDTEQLHNYLEQERLAVKARLAKPSFASFGKCYLMDRYSRPTLSFSVYKCNVTFWTTDGCTTIAQFKEVPDENTLNEMMDKVQAGERKCNDCGSWHPAKEMKHYSFAGVVCQKCFDPKKHLPPDTRGD